MPHVVTCLLENDGHILILKRSDEVGTYKEVWAGVSGFIDEHEEPYAAALKEIKEEVGIDQEGLKLIQQCEVVKFSDLYEDKYYDWIVHPFLFHIHDRESIQIDWEHTEYRWIKPSELKNFETVPRFKEVVQKMLV